MISGSHTEVPYRDTTLGAIVTGTGGVIQTGPFGSQLHASDYVLSGAPLVMPVNLGDNEIIESGIARVGESDVRRLSRHLLRQNDIVFSRRGDVGRRSIVRTSEVGWLCGTGCLAARFGSRLDDVNPAYIAHYLGLPSVQAWLLDNSVGGTMPNLNTGILAATPIRIPERRAQDYIVAALDTVGAAVARIERLIAKKQSIKQGMMQQLLTGKTRLHGFNQSWRTVKLAELGSFLKGRGVKRDDVRPSGTACIRYGELYTTFRNYASEVVSYVDRTVAATALPIRTGDLLFAGSGETRDEIGMCVAYVGGGPAVAGGDIVVLRGSEFNPIFLASLANMPYVASQKARLGQGDAVVHISSAALSSVEVELPPPAEQDAIADVIVASDRELKVLQWRLAKAKAVKQGMMQELLTGRTRLQPAEAMV